MKFKWFPAFGVLTVFLTFPVTGQAQYECTTNNGTITIIQYTGLGGDVIITNQIQGLSVVAIADSAFSSLDGLTGVTIPNTVTNIERYAFSYCENLTFASISGSVVSVGESAFESCPKLTNVVIGSGVEVIGDYVFYECLSLPEITLPASISFIGDLAFLFCTSLESIHVDELNPFYASYGGVLVDRALNSIVQCPSGKKGFVSIPESIISIGDFAFYNCSVVTELYFSGDTPSLGANAFDGFSATIFCLPGSLGWGDTYGGLPSFLWSPKIEEDAGFASGFFGFTISGSNDYQVVVEASTNLTESLWTSVQTNSLSGGECSFSDPENYPVRFYKLSMP